MHPNIENEQTAETNIASPNVTTPLTPQIFKDFEDEIRTDDERRTKESVDNPNEQANVNVNIPEIAAILQASPQVAERFDTKAQDASSNTSLNREEILALKDTNHTEALRCLHKLRRKSTRTS